MTISPFTKNPTEQQKSQDHLNLVELFETFPLRLKSEPDDATSMVEAMSAIDKSKSRRVLKWGDNSNIIGRIGNVYAALDPEAAEIVDAMSVGSLDELGLKASFSAYRNDEYLKRVTQQDASLADTAGVPVGVSIQEEMAKEARMIIESSFELTDSNFTLAR
jgi:hypothetical protein